MRSHPWITGWRQKTQTRLRTALWLQAKVSEHGLGLWFRLYSGPVCDNSAADAAYAAWGAI